MPHLRILACALSATVGLTACGPGTTHHDSSLTLDGGALRVVPAGAGTHAGWGSAQEALDQAQGALRPFTRGGYELESGVNVQLAQVTIRAGVTYGGGANGPSGAVDPTVPSYRDRLAWVVSVRVRQTELPACPAPDRDRPSPSPETGHRGYVVLVQDATHGGDAAVYTERGPSICGGGYDGPYVEVPQRLVAEPWTVHSRAPATGVLTVDYNAPPCATFDDYANASEQGAKDFALLVDLPLGPTCPGTARRTSPPLMGIRTDVRPYAAGPLGVDGHQVPHP